MIDDSGTPTMTELKQQVFNEVRNLVDDHPRPEDCRDHLHEIAESNVPTMNAALLLMALHDLTLGFPDEVPDAESTVSSQGAYGVIGWAIYEQLREEAENVWREQTGEEV